MDKFTKSYLSGFYKSASVGDIASGVGEFAGNTAADLTYRPVVDLGKNFYNGGSCLLHGDLKGVAYNALAGVGNAALTGLNGMALQIGRAHV